MISRPVSLRNFIVAEGFWKDRMELVRTEVIPYQWDILNDRVTDANPSYCMRNFRVAGKLLKEQREMRASFQEPVYTFSGVVQATPDKLRSSYSVMTYHKEGPACGKIPCDPTSSEARPCQQSCRDGLRMSALRAEMAYQSVKTTGKESASHELYCT